ncbi:hypothetical protein AB0O47_16730 [Streptomyces noursei]|uniref:hypothetical protein n=1 Tax=Streptomyces noursei TaxID=1971 RepID=UPI00344B3167
MNSHVSTAAVPEWSFVLFPHERPTGEDSDRFDCADSLAGGEIGWEEGPDGVQFPCAVKAPHLEVAVSWATERLGELGLIVGRIEMTLPLPDADR